jgi:ketosteroid isomerase-like protein
MNGCIKNVLFIFLLFFLGSSCATKKKEEPVIVDYKSEMIEADRNFSKMSESLGMRYAMLQYIDNKGILLRPNAVPLVGGEAINFISQGNDSSYTMTWEPSGGTIAISGELGYTYGIYSLKPKTRDTVYYGTYVSIWKRQPDGKWKFSLETGNAGIE